MKIPEDHELSSGILFVSVCRSFRFRMLRSDYLERRQSAVRCCSYSGIIITEMWLPGLRNSFMKSQML